MDKSNAPFSPGQRLVSIKSGFTIKRGMEVVCNGCFYCEKCKEWVVITDVPDGITAKGDCACGNICGPVCYTVVKQAKYFRQIEYNSISHQLANEAMQSDKAVEVDIVQPVKEGVKENC